MNERDLKRAIDSIQQSPGMETRVRRAVVNDCRFSKDRRRRPLLQGSVIAAACCAAAAAVVVITSFQIGSLGGGYALNVTSQGQCCPGAPGKQPGESSNRVEVTLSRASGIPVSDGISFSAAVTGPDAERLTPQVRTDQGTFIPDGDTGDKTVSGTWLIPTEEAIDGQRFIASVSVMDDSGTPGKSKYLIAIYHKESQTLSVEVSDSPDG